MRDYEPVFRIPELNIFTTNLLSKGYLEELESIIIIKNKKWVSFSHKDILNEAAEEGFRSALEEGYVEKFEYKSTNLGNNFQILNKEDLERMNNEEFICFLDKFFDLSHKFLDEYRKTEFIYAVKIEKELNEFLKGKHSFQDLLSNKLDLGSFPKDMKSLAEYVIKMQHIKLRLRQMINEFFMGDTSILFEVFNQILNRTNRNDAVNMTLKELKDCLNKQEVKDVSNREIYSYIELNNKGFQIFSGEEGFKKIEEFEKQIEFDKDINKKELRGLSACMGIARGKVKIIPLSLGTSFDYFSKFDKGNILVSDTTGPEMTSLIEKAAAIITNEGGIMSHAAVISREFGIPCIVGTKHATEVLKDGDFIEVDANTGTIRRLE